MPARFWLGMAQMFGATTAGVLLFWTGLSAATLGAIALTTACTVFSRVPHRRDSTVPSTVHSRDVR